MVRRCVPSEWGFSKLLHWLRHNPGKRDRFASAFEHCESNKGAERFCESKFEAGREEACEGDTESSCLLFL